MATCAPKLADEPSQNGEAQCEFFLCCAIVAVALSPALAVAQAPSSQEMLRTDEAYREGTDAAMR
jgi:hypothetical protein